MIKNLEHSEVPIHVMNTCTDGLTAGGTLVHKCREYMVDHFSENGEIFGYSVNQLYDQGRMNV